MDWQDFDENFDYVKDFYEVLLPSGEIIKKCWPNAGKMNATDGSGRYWESGIKVRPDLENLLGD
jgi:hypothetical protein